MRIPSGMLLTCRIWSKRPGKDWVSVSLTSSWVVFLLQLPVHHTHDIQGLPSGQAVFGMCSLTPAFKSQWKLRQSQVCIPSNAQMVKEWPGSPSGCYHARWILSYPIPLLVCQSAVSALGISLEQGDCCVIMSTWLQWLAHFSNSPFFFWKLALKMGQEEWSPIFFSVTYGNLNC